MQLTSAIMETEYLEYTPFTSRPPKKTLTWDVTSRSNGAFLGTVLFRPQWRKYVFQPAVQSITVFDSVCLICISNFLNEKNDEWRKSIQARRKKQCS